MRRKDTVLVLVAAFNVENNENQILIGEGLTLVEAIVRAVEYEFTDEELRNIIQVYGPDDVTGLYDWYLSREIFLSEPMIIPKNGSNMHG